MRGAEVITARLREEGRLHPGRDADEAATLLWELISFRVWGDLVNESGLEPDRYIEIVTAAALAALAGIYSNKHLILVCSVKQDTLLYSYRF